LIVSGDVHGVKQPGRRAGGSAGGDVAVEADLKPKLDERHDRRGDPRDDERAARRCAGVGGEAARQRHHEDGEREPRRAVHQQRLEQCRAVVATKNAWSSAGAVWLGAEAAVAVPDRAGVGERRSRAWAAVGLDGDVRAVNALAQRSWWLFPRAIREKKMSVGPSVA
jgi:hypothetical protein